MLATFFQKAPALARGFSVTAPHSAALCVAIRRFHDSAANNQQQHQQHASDSHAAAHRHMMTSPARDQANLSYRERMAREYARNLIKEAQGGAPRRRGFDSHKN
mmetsp:Transcript_17251/g.50118  ORF Transcript_17251/g.50118 Transcript_17251/m.50118 type:complete len:104 (+) Transcript_17251:65-376(+)